VSSAGEPIDAAATSRPRSERTRLLSNLSGRLEVRIDGEASSAKIVYEVINLDRRPERLAAFQIMAGQQDPELASVCARRAGIDGATLDATPELLRWIEGNIYDSERGIIGCALSHLGAWRDAAARLGTVTVVLEDDVSVAPGFASTAARVIGAADRQIPQWDVLFFGCTKRGPRDDPSGWTLKRMRWHQYAGGLFAYALSASGAAAIAALLDSCQLTEAIDCMLLQNRRSIRAYEVVPHIAWADVAGPHRPWVPTDVQRDTGALLP
jgi:GR25 family glycosyltransferase involved in LPS biosynthesis